MECIVPFIGLHLNNVRLYHKKDSNILYIIRDDSRRPGLRLSLLPLSLHRLLLLPFSSSLSVSLLLPHFHSCPCYRSLLPSILVLCSLFFKSYIYIRLRFNYKVRYVSGSPGIVLHTISRDWRVSHPRYTRPTSVLALEKQDVSRARHVRVQRNEYFVLFHALSRPLLCCLR